MRYARKTASTIVLTAVMAFGLIAPNLRAGPPAGKFNLPFDANWGTVTLPTGDYTFSLANFTSRGTILVYRAGQPVGFVRPQAFETNENHGKDSALICIRHDGKVTVRALRTDRGTFYFYVPKDLKTLVAQQPELIETVSVKTGE
jgi:hypothetical protein